LGIDFANLPYLIDGDIKISQSLAIPRYAARKGGKTDLLGKTPKDMALVDNIILAFSDCMTQFTALAFSKKFEDDWAPMFYKVKPKFQKFEKLFAEKKFCLGYLTLADFLIAEGSYYMERFFYEEYGQFKSFHKIRESVNNLP